MVDGFLSHHSTHIASSGRVADHCSTASDQGDRLVTCHLQSLHQAKRHKVTYVKAVCCGIKTNIKGSFTVIDQLLNFFFVCQLSKKTSCFQLVINRHRLLSPLILFEIYAPDTKPG